MAALVAWGVGCADAGAQSPAAPAADAAITTVGQFWAMTADQKARPQPYRFDFVVTYADPTWRLIWAEQGRQGFYVPYFRGMETLRMGERVHLEGTFPAESPNLDFNDAIVTRTGMAELEPVRLLDLDKDPVAYGSDFVEAEGLVDRQDEGDPRHLQLTLSVEGRAVFARVLVEPDKLVPQYPGAFVRLSGVCVPKVGSDGGLVAVDLLVGGLDRLSVLGWIDNDPRFQVPPVPIGELRAVPPDRIVHIRGRVTAQEPGRSLTLRDDSGQIVVLTGQSRPCAIDEPIEAVGYPMINGTRWELGRGLFRAVSIGAAEPRRPMAEAHLTAQVLELTPAEAQQGVAVNLVGVVTWASPDAPYYYVEDASGGVAVRRGAAKSVPDPGVEVRVRGRTTMGDFAPAIEAASVGRTGTTLLPEARVVTLAHALTGVEEAQWVEMRGYVREAVREGAATRLEIATPDGRFAAILPATDEAARWVGAVVRLRGVCRAVADERRKQTGVHLLVPAGDMVQIDEAAPEDPFDAPQRSLAELGRFGTLAAINHRVKVAGTVLRQAADRSLNLIDSDGTLLVTTRQTPDLAPGDRVEAVGYLGRQGGRVLLRDAIVRRTGAVPLAPALRVTAAAIRPELDGRLVTVPGRLIDAAVVRGRMRLTLESDQLFYEASLDLPAGEAEPPDWPEQARLELTAVCEIKYGDDGRPAGFQLALRAPDDVRVLERPSWFTRTRVLAIAATLLLGSLAFVAWIVGLRRQVARQTRQIREQLRRESLLEEELQRAARLESLGLLAGGIAHDFNNLLTIVMGNLSLAALDEQIGAESTTCLREASKAVMRARDLTQQLLTFAKGGAPLRTAVMMPDVVREVAEFALHGSDVQCRFAIPAGLWPADADKGQVAQVVQNIVINARQAMTAGGCIEIALENATVAAGGVLAPGRYLRLRIADHGPGIAPADLQRIFEPYFTTKKHGNGLGLATVYSIVKKHHGHVAAESVVGEGTTFTVWLPAAAEADPAPASDQPQPVVAAVQGARVLFMDDDEEIRRVGEAILRRLGHAVTAVADGAAAVEAYTRALTSPEPFHLVILDLTVPGGMGGRQAMEQLRERDPAVRAIVSSGYSNDEALANYRAHGFRGRVAKPYEFDDLARTINRVLQGESV